MLGIREPGMYGAQDLCRASGVYRGGGPGVGVQTECFQSNHEGAIVDRIQAAYRMFDGIVINPAAYTHTSVAILDALKAVALPAVEVHLTDVSQREEFRNISYAGLACEQRYIGMGFEGYKKAIAYLAKAKEEE